ncbi:MAG: helix-hairpin-helix domain-containing protein [Candidatus Absconditabacteria bacterium]|nr:helix-hairpin-helix domain-containing protein [Candidatus Absconditabacteria bacterium]MDD3868507.1 helix-hairpin-helix domain-containing protein [Candidatus Absconditabacteria bacterium]MDD4713897.1 helix-hairpin-helix domain-containing protein [Candidatus Absconditabacteria bacterium]
MPKSPLTKLVNIGPKIADHLIKIGITTPEEFLQRDPYEVFYLLKTRVDPSFCRCMLAAIVAAKEGGKWNTYHISAAVEFQKRYPDIQWKTAWKGC